MSLLFIIQLSVSIAALAVTSDQQHDILKAGWHKAASAKEKSELQTKLDCCGFETVKFNVSSTNPSCSGVSINHLSDDIKFYHKKITHFLDSTFG